MISRNAIARLILGLVALFHCSVGLSQSELFTQISPPLDGGACVDAAPFDDDFGWNGTCSCVLDQAVRGFGDSLDIQGNTAAIGYGVIFEKYENLEQARLFRS